MTDFLAKVVGAISFTLKHWFLAFILSLLLLVMPVSILDTLAITNYITQYRAIVGGIFLLSSGVLVVFGAPLLFNRIVGASKQWARRAVLTEHLTKLSDEEKELLTTYLIEHVSSLRLASNDQIAIQLTRKSILRTAPKYQSVQRDFHIDEWVFDYLYSHPELLK
jgi:hypothetical protein